MDVTIPNEGVLRVQDDVGGAKNRFYRLIYPTQ
jgi:hypothetical protein